MISRHRPLLIAGVLALVVAVGLGTWAFVASGDDWSAPSPTGEKVDAGLTTFYEQSVDWRDCGRAKCADVKAPVDYADPGGETFKLAVRVYPAEGKRQGSLFVNPGGPGGSAMDFAAAMVGRFGRSVTQAYDVVGVDPRGVGDSTPLKCLGNRAMDQFVATDPDPDDAAEIRDLRDEIAGMGDACEKNSGELAAHVSTEEAARDMDLVRALLGDEKMNWFGASYGTQLGATYATLFPKKVGRMVLDGAVDPSLDAFQSALGQTTGFQRAFDAYAAACQKKSSCPLGDSVGEARSIVSDYLTKLDQQPQKTRGDRELTEGNAFYGLALPLYSQETWDVLTQALTAALTQDDGTMLLAFSDAYFGRDPSGTYTENIGQVIYAVNCLDASTGRPSEAEVEKRLPEFTKVSPVFGRALGWGVLSCTDWPLTSKTPQIKISAPDANPIVVIGTTRDPATPYEWAGALAKQLGSGVLVSRDGDGHTAYGQGNQCIDDLVDSYLVKGDVPKNGTLCKAS